MQRISLRSPVDLESRGMGAHALLSTWSYHTGFKGHELHQAMMSTYLRRLLRAAINPGTSRELVAINGVLRPLCGKGSSRNHSNSPFATPATTAWASTSEDDIHVADKKAEDGSVKFSSFPLGKEVLSRLKDMGCETTFEIQAKTLPLTLSGRDVIGRAVTGSGKTLAYALPIIQVLANTPRTRQPRALVITPTRELCNQVNSCIQSLDSRVRCVPLYGGASYSMQERALHRGVDVICATPGRLNDHLQRGNFDLDDIKFLVLDEADELLTPNFKRQIENILRDTPTDKQMMMFSATMPPDIKDITREYMNNAEMVDLVTDRKLIPEGIVHEKLEIPEHKKMETVCSLLLANQPKRALVFMPRKALTRVMASKVTQAGFRAAALNSDISQSGRDAVFRSFKEGHVDVLVATDVAARGLDVPELDLVIQVGVPPNGVDFYIHRSGRTGRKGQPGRTILIYDKFHDVLVKDLLKDLSKNGIKLKHIQAPGKDALIRDLIKKTVTKVNPVTLSGDLMSLARPYAQELIDEYGVDGIAALLASVATTSYSADEFAERASHSGSRGFPRDGPSRDDYPRSRNRDNWGGAYSQQRGDYGETRDRRGYGGETRGRRGYEDERRRGYTERRGGYGREQKGYRKGQAYGSEDNEFEDLESWDNTDRAPRSNDGQFGSGRGGGAGSRDRGKSRRNEEFDWDSVLD